MLEPSPAHAQNAAASASTTTGITTSSAARSRPARPTRNAETAIVGVLPEDKLSRSNAKSRADWNRIAGSFSKQWWTIRSNPGDTCRLLSLNSGGSSFRMAFIVSTLDLP